MSWSNYVASLSLRSALPEGSYLRDLPAVGWLAAGHTLAFTAPVTFLVGENGSGKSTLLERSEERRVGKECRL